MNFKLLKRIFAVVVFLISFIVLYSTVQPSVSFWDCGEFIAASYYLQVPHPPGTPFFLLLGRIFSLIPFAENIAFRINIISVLTSALSVFFLYLIAVKVIENYRGREYKNTFDAVATFVAAAIGALSFSFSDTFWFNGVEAEVYAFSTFLFGGVTYLMMRWNERADSKDNEKYLLMIAFLVGLSTGVHLMSVLAVVPVVMVIFARKYVDDEEAYKKTAYIFIVHAAVILVFAIAMWASQKSSVPPSPEEFLSYDSKFKMLIAGISALIVGAFWKKIFTRNSFYMPLIIGGIALFATYPGVVKFLPELMAKISGNDITLELLTLIVLFAALGYGVRYTIKANKPTLNLVFMSLIFILIGFTTFAMVIIRANQDPPMNENRPDKFTELVSYLNREQYGDFPTFKRRFASEPHQVGVYSNYSSDLDFFWRYQMNHMMTRYFLWNYAGREGWNQDDGPNIAPFNQLGNLFGRFFNIRFEGSVKDSLFGIPFLIGIIGIFFHFKRDWKMASAFMIMFILMGYLTAFYQNQQEPQPRERDYFYVGAFFVFSIWIAIGVRGLVTYIQNKFEKISIGNAAAVGVLAIGIILIPVRMLQANYHTHDRSKNWVPWDYSYNLLQSCAPGAVLFTNGDNDTFPLWYLQDVEGVRRDIKIVNLSLVNTPWYILQLKNSDPYNVGTVNIKLKEDQIERLQLMQWNPQDITLPLPAPGTAEYNQLAASYPVSDSTILKEGKLTFRMNNTITSGSIKAIRVQDFMVKEIIEANNWKRPIYFAVTCSDDSKIGLNDYLLMEGMAQRLVPEKRNPRIEFINEPVLRKQLFDENPSFSKDYKPGFKFRGMNDPDIFFDENHVRLSINYRNAFIRLALYYLNINQNENCVRTLDLMEEKMPRDLLEMDYRLLFDIGNLYFNAGGLKQYDQIAREVEKVALQKIDEDPMDASTYYNPYRLLIETYDNLKEYNKAIDILNQLKMLYQASPNVVAQLNQEIERYRLLAKGNDTLLQK